MKKTLIKLIARFVGHKGITFDGSRVYYWKVPMIVLPMEVLAYMQKNFESAFGIETRKIMYSLGKLQGRNGTNILIEKFNIVPDDTDLSFFMEQTEFVGIGKIRLEKSDIKNGYILVHNEGSPNAIAYMKLFGNRESPICDYVRGLLAGAGQAIFYATTKQKDLLEGIEIDCISQGKPACKIEIRKAVEFDKNDAFIKNELPVSFAELDYAFEKESLAMLLRPHVKSVSETETELSKAIKKNHGEYHLKYDEGGVVSVLGKPCLVTPLDIFMLLQYVLEKRFGERVNQIMYEAGEYLGKESTLQTFTLFKFDKKNIRHVNMAFEQVGLYGLGKFTPVIMDTINHKYIFKVENPPGNHYMQLIGLKKQKVDYFLAGFLNGVLSYVFDSRFITQEDSCVVSGSSFCVFKSNRI
jgi:predicted hydrocarbon binding protein